MEKNIFEQIWDYFYGVFLSAEPGYYENLDFDKSPLFSVRFMVLGLFVGAIIACIIMAYNKQLLGKVVRGIIASGATSHENAMTVSELGFGKSWLIKNALRSSSNLQRFVRCVGAEEFYAAQNAEREALEAESKESGKRTKFKERSYLIDIETDRFYIPEEKKDAAEIRYSNKHSGILALVLGILALLVALFVVLLILPWVFDGVNDIVGIFKG